MAQTIILDKYSISHLSLGLDVRKALLPLRKETLFDKQTDHTIYNAPVPIATRLTHLGQGSLIRLIQTTLLILGQIQEGRCQTR